MSQPTLPDSYGNIHSAIVHLLEEARRAAARSVNALMTASYWEIGRRKEHDHLLLNLHHQPLLVLHLLT